MKTLLPILGLIMLIIPFIALAIIMEWLRMRDCLFWVYGGTIVVIGWVAIAGYLITGYWFK